MPKYVYELVINTDGPLCGPTEGIRRPCRNKRRCIPFEKDLIWDGTNNPHRCRECLEWTKPFDKRW